MYREHIIYETSAECTKCDRQMLITNDSTKVQGNDELCVRARKRT